MQFHTAPVHDPHRLIGRTVSHYEIEEKLGGGGMGVVYKARDAKLDRRVALKFLLPQLSTDDEANARFIGEARAASALDHPNICTIYEIDETEEGSLFIVMAFYEGQTLKKRIGRGPLPVEKAVRLAIEIAQGLSRAHEAGIIHRDVKPANIMLTDRDEVKILDFGLAKLAGVELSKPGTMMGTVPYMSPEQIRSDGVNHRTDIWALGVVLYEMLTGKRPFEGDYVEAVIYLILNVDPEAVTVLRPDLPDPLKQLIEKTLAKRPDERYQHINEVLIDLRDIIQPPVVTPNLWPSTGKEVSTPVIPANWPPAEAIDRQNLLLVLRKVHQFWIEGVLVQSIHGEALIDLGKETQPDAISHPWEQVIELPDQTIRTLPPGQALGELFGKVGRSLLILGAPGSGKTITLLDLARDLIECAEADPTQPIPAVFNLSSWSGQRQSLFDWLIEELNTKYQVPKKMSRAWLEENRLALLLDGLDEVRGENQAACVEAINLYVEEHGVPGLSVCCRLEEYTALPVRLKVSGAIRLQPLSPEQVKEYVAHSGDALTGLHAALKQDRVLQTLAETPLMLDVMTMAYRDMPAEALANDALDTVEARRSHLFATYIGRMFRRKGKADQSYTKEQTMGGLTWLARKMQQDGEVVFMIEQLQPSWLATRAQRWGYVLSTRLIGGVIAGLTFGFLAGLTMELIELARIGDRGPPGPIFMLFYGAGPKLGLIAASCSGMIFGLGAGLAIGFIDTARLERGNSSRDKNKASTLWKSVIHVFTVMLSAGLVGGLGVAMVWGPKEGLELGLFFGILFGMIWGTRKRSTNPMHDIRTVEALSWSRTKAGAGSLIGLLAGLILGLSVGLLIPLLTNRATGPREVLLIGFVWSLSYGVMGGIFGGLNSSIVKGKTVPNQGIILSRRNAVYAGVIFSLIGGLSQGLLSWLVEGALAGLFIGVCIGMILGISAALWYGGLDVIHHYTLRFLFFRNGHMPGRYVRFLDYARKLIFLQRVGGGYIFVHRLLLEYFAAIGALDSNAPKPPEK